jgi:nucleoside-diphosphate-sugar epimerase
MYGQNSLFHLCANPSFDFTRGDVRDQDLMRRLLKGTDVIIPLAALVGAPACNNDPWMAQAVNLEAIRLLNRLRSSNQLVVFPTTNSGYGTKSGDTYCTEETPLEPISQYGREKVQAEEELLGTPNTISLRFATVFGMSPRMRLDLLVNHFVYAAVTDGYLVIFEKDFKRNYLHIRDAADCFLHAVENAKSMAGRAFNAGLDAANLSKEELALKVKKFVPEFYLHFSEIGSDPDKRNYIVSNERLKKAGFEAQRSLDQGIEELLKGYRMIGRLPLRNA